MNKKSKKEFMEIMRIEKIGKKYRDNNSCNCALCKYIKSMIEGTLKGIKKKQKVCDKCGK